MGIEFRQGTAEFKDASTLLVDGEELKGKKYIISTGSSPFVPDIEGIESVPYLTNETFFELERLPESLIVLGGGPIGVELAQATRRLGTRVELVEMMDTLMFREERDFSLAIQDRLSEEGVHLHLGARAERVSSTEKRVVLHYDRKGEIHSVEAHALLVAIGRKPNLDGLGLDKAGIRYNRKGIEVNSRMQTSRSKIYAVGDVAGPYQFSHMANAQGILATQNAILPVKRSMNYKHVAWVTFTEPEMARAGMTEAEARDWHGDSVRVYPFDFNQLDRSLTGGKSIERAKLILDKKGKVLGASILADRAGELMGELQLLKSRGINFAAMGSVIHPYPTYAELFSKIGKKVLVDNILNHPLVSLFRKKESI
jgi:pyruvate/2-oxoglutarate dehydrogenase complex dihydrolipoamide dehydrogenase (E3) component